MPSQIYPHYISKESLLKEYPTLYYGTDGKWFAVITPDEKICGLTLAAFPNSHYLLKRYKNHSLIEKEIHLKENVECLLAGTPFQHQVWQALLEIPKGTTVTYQALANRLQRPKAVRAIGNAVGANPITPLIPCHRVVGTNRHSGGYFWGMEAKVELLQEEQITDSSFLLRRLAL